ncbi:autotransporter domain-containing protein [Achromobacter seleniivolatilans]|uniref:Autotransporter domain-containing protein n=1 Tax=Achromobacter seleniivolatilans TaxID=3047478 RepID=A0ABY9M3V8_9BURK|nr:autotransporter domain-containing protein [Achromobacter sp. R39]WMD21635.1 autotransporter domain-containing protein [Achromobacter sp. R39]
MTSRVPFPRKTTLAIAMAAALSSTLQVAGAAGGPYIVDTIVSAVAWGAGDVTVTTNGTITDFQPGFPLTATSGTLGSLHNQGVIEGVGGLGVTVGALITSVLNQGTISSTGRAAIQHLGVIGSLTNDTSGLIRGGPAVSAIYTDGIIVNLSNLGTISAGGGLWNDGTIMSMDNQGALTGTARNAILTTGNIGTLTNTGTINAIADTAILNSGTIGNLVNGSTGVIAGSETIGGIAAMETSGTINNFLNQGTIRANAGLSNTGSIGTLTNSGTITATGIAGGNGNSGIALIVGSLAGNGDPATLSVLNNSGLIGGQEYAIAVGRNGTLGILNNSGTIAGNIADGSGHSLTINGGSNNQFGTITGANGTIGQIASLSPTLEFGSGNLLLNSHINLQPTGPAPTATVANTGATLQVNNPITISGNYTQAAGATLQIGVSPFATTSGNPASDAGYGRLVVTGAATVAAGSAVALQKVNAFAFAPGQRYVVISANAVGTNYNESALLYRINGAPNGIVTGTQVNEAGTSNLVLTVNSVGEVVTPVDPNVPTIPTDPTAPTTPTTPTTPAIPPIPATIANSYASLNGLAQYTGISDPALLNLFNAGQALRLGSASDANQAGAKLAPVNSSSTARAADAATINVVNLISQRNDSVRLGQAGGSGVATGDSGPTWAAWGQAFGGHASQNQRDNVDGYGANFGGLLLGLDRGIGERWRVGGVVSYSGTEVDFKDNTSGNSTHVDSYGFMAYGSYTANTWYTNLSAGLVEQRYRTKRSVDFTGFQGDAHGRFDGQQYVVRAEAGVPIAAGATTITPLAALTYNYVRQDGYTETGGNGAALSVGSTNATSVTSDLGVKFARDFSTSYGTLTPELQLGWRHEFRNNKVLTNASFAGDPTGATAFTTVGASPVRDAALVSAGLTLLKSNNLSISARYELQAGSGFVSQAGGLRLRQLF